MHSRQKVKRERRPRNPVWDYLFWFFVLVVVIIVARSCLTALAA